jgi:hypothetical protein
VHNQQSIPGGNAGWSLVSKTACHKQSKELYLHFSHRFVFICIRQSLYRGLGQDIAKV